MKGYAWRTGTEVSLQLLHVATGQICAQVESASVDEWQATDMRPFTGVFMGRFNSAKKARSAAEKAIAAPAQPGPTKQVEVCRSFSYKLNLANYGGPQYESADFFCSRKTSADEDFAQAVSHDLHQQCQIEVRQKVAEFIADMKETRRLAAERSRNSKYGGKGDAAGLEQFRKDEEKKLEGNIQIDQRPTSV